jgi:hypothetical protein
LALANYLSNPNFVPYELIDESMKEERRGFSLDLLRYMRVLGLKPSKTRMSMRSAPVLSEQESIPSNHKKFALQFFDKFMEYLSPPKQLGAEFYLKVLFPVLTNYLNRYITYFLPVSNMQTSSSTASKEEKRRLLK